MQATKVSECDLDINLTPGEDSEVRIKMDGGFMYLSFSGILLSDHEVWYELPIAAISDVGLEGDDPCRIKFVTEDMEIVIKGKDPNKLKALRHYLLPFVC